jgi:FAD/FMN-containing dehydrogenase
MARSARSAASPSLLHRIGKIVGGQGLLTEPADLEPFLGDWRGFFRGTAQAVVRPATTEQVAAVVKLCAETGTAIVPQGGNTGMSGAATPPAGGGAIVLQMGRMSRIIEIDALNNTITVEAGCILANIQQAARDAGRLFPLSLGAEGSCQIGGNLATNAGGINVLRYGNARDLTLGLQVVLPDGRVWDGLRGLRKDNTGYDLKQIFIGSEGTLGIITAAVLKLFPIPRSTVTAMIAVAGPAAALELLALLRDACGDRVSAFEMISRQCVELVLEHIPGTREPLARAYPWYVLAELADASPNGPLREESERTMESAVERGLALDATIAANEAQRTALWRIRESIPEASRAPEVLYRHDISIPISRIPEFIEEAGAVLGRAFPGARVICFGHVGDGNLHYNCFVPGRRRDDAAALAATDVNRTVLEVVQHYGGSFSAEHGIGQAKRAELARYKGALEVEMMRALKRAFDPRNLMNPGKVLPDGPSP